MIAWKFWRRGLVALLALALLTVGGVSSALAQEPVTDPVDSVQDDDEKAIVTVAHFAPFAASVDGTAVDVRVNGQTVLENFKFGEVSDELALPEGRYRVEILPAGTDTVVLSGRYELDEETEYTLIATGGSNGTELSLLPLKDRSRAPKTKARVRIGHLAPFAEDRRATAVNICTEDDTPVLKDVVYGDVVNLVLDAGVYDLKVVPAASDCGAPALDLPAVLFEGGTVVDLFVIGNIDPLPLTFQSTTGVNLAQATVSVAHYAPFADTSAGTSVTVRVNGADALTDFRFGDIVKDVPLPPGPTLIQVLPTGTDTVAIEAELDLQAGVDYTVAAIGDIANQPLALLPLVDDNDPNWRVAKVRVGHLAPFAPSLPGTAVDICTDTGEPVLTDVRFSDVANLELRPGVYDLAVTLAGSDCAAVALDLPAVRFARGDVADLFVIGNISAQPLSVSSISGLNLAPEPEEQPALVTVAHFAPFARPRRATSVTVRANGADLITDFLFGQIKRKLEVTPGDYLIEILPTGTDNVVLSGELTFDPGTRYFVAAIGGGRFLPLELFVLTYENGRWQRSVGPASGGAMLRIAHLAPLASKVDDTLIDVCTDSGELVAADVPYKSFASLELAPGSHDLKISSAGAACSDLILDLPSLDLAAGEEAELFTVGDNVMVPLQAVSESGLAVEQKLFVPFVAR